MTKSEARQRLRELRAKVNDGTLPYVDYISRKRELKKVLDGM